MMTLRNITISLLLVWTGGGCGPGSETVDRRRNVSNRAESGDLNPRVATGSTRNSDTSPQDDDNSPQLPPKLSEWRENYCQATTKQLVTTTHRPDDGKPLVLPDGSRFLVTGFNIDRKSLSVVAAIEDEIAILENLSVSSFELDCLASSFKFGNRHLVAIEETVLFATEEVSESFCELEEGILLGQVGASKGLTGFRKIDEETREVSSNEILDLCGQNSGFYFGNSIIWVFGKE